ncbi:unnamed protein product, partial [marine sediment metagenome]
AILSAYNEIVNKLVTTPVINNIYDKLSEKYITINTITARNVIPL